MTTNTGHEVVLPSHIDVAADARVIKNVADKTIQKILNKRMEMDRAGLEDEPFSVAHGEDHRMTGNKLRLMAVLDGLRRAGEPVAMAFEYPYDELLCTYEEEAGFQRTPASDAALIQQDRESAGAFTLQNDMAFAGSTQSDHMTKTVMQYCRNTGLPAAFTDAARPDLWLNEKDATTKASIEACIGSIPQHDIYDCSPEGMHIRNHHMLRCARETAMQYDSRIILQQTGHSHVAGNRSANYEARNSLLGLSRNFFTAVLGFAPVIKGFTADDIDKEDLAVFGVKQNLHFLELPEITAKYDPFTDAPEGAADLQSRKEEAAYISGVLQAMGLGHHAMSAEAYERQLELDYQHLQERFAAIDKQTRAQPVAKPA